MEVPNPTPTTDPVTPEPLPPQVPKRRAREEAPVATPPDEEILALAARLQALIGRRREQSETSPSTTTNSPRDTRLRPRQTPLPAKPDDEILAVLAEARATVQPARLYHGPNAEDDLEALAGRWLRRALWPVIAVLAAALAFTLGKRSSTVAREPDAQAGGAPALVTPGRAPATGANLPVAPAAPPRWSEKSLEALDEIFAARRRGDPARAETLARALRTQEGALPGLDLFLGENLVSAQQVNDATTALLQLMRADRPVAAAMTRLGSIAARERRLDEAAGYFASASAADPFRGDLFARWAEALRRQGKAAEAVTRFDQALLRPADDEGSRRPPPDTAFRRRLARLEAGEVNPVRQETTAALAGPVTPETGRWLLTAAALDLVDNHVPQAAATFARARAAVPAAEWDRLTGDLFFRNYAGRRELTEFIPPAGSAADAKRVAALSTQPDVDFIDP